METLGTDAPGGPIQVLVEAASMHAVAIHLSLTPQPPEPGVTDAPGLHTVGVHCAHPSIEAPHLIAGVALTADKGVAPGANVVQAAVTVLAKHTLSPILTRAQVSTAVVW